MSAHLSPETKRAFAQEQFEELRGMGLTKRVAGELMSTVGPALSVETVSWLIHTWEVFEKWLTNLYHKNRKYRGYRKPKCEEVRSEIRALFFVGGSTGFPSTIYMVGELLKVDLVEDGVSPLDFGLTIPTPEKYKKILKGVDVLLPYFPLKH